MNMLVRASTSAHECIHVGSNVHAFKPSLRPQPRISIAKNGNTHVSSFSEPNSAIAPHCASTVPCTIMSVWHVLLTPNGGSQQDETSTVAASE